MTDWPLWVPPIQYYWPDFEYDRLRYQNLKMHLNLLLSSVVSLDRSPSPARFATMKVKPLRVKVKPREEVGHPAKVWPVILQSNSVILQGTLVGHLKSVMLKTS